MLELGRNKNTIHKTYSIQNDYELLGEANKKLYINMFESTTCLVHQGY